ncbi:MAG: DUF4386 domain-containing protein [Chloroflexales bacterium]|nr:DUF4386 domain-containing protein [Chloroflexales bacterium]
MTTIGTRRLTGSLLILVPLAFTACFTLLQIQFEYPDILRQPTADVLAKFQAGGSGLVAVWYVLTLTAVLFIPVVVLLHHVLAGQDASLTLRVATVFGIVAGLAQTLGFLRWPFLVPHLAATYLAPEADAAQRAAAAIAFDAFHRYAGMAVGEHLGYLSTSAWTFLVALLMLRAPLFGRWLGVSGMVLALGVATGLLEPAGVPAVGAINAISYLAWALWLVIVGAVLLLRRPDAAPAKQALTAAR